MQELHIQVTLQNQQKRAYVFREFPVRIGRSAACHLQIDHEAVPRELCIAWLETDQCTVRVEERPGLTNPLLCKNTRVDGGISGKLLELKAGPATLVLSSEPPREKTKDKKGTLGVVGALSAGVALLIMAAGRSGSTAKNEVDIFAVLPRSPVCAEPEVRCEALPECKERARLLRERAAETLSRRGDSVSEKVRAVLQLRESLRLCQRVDLPAAAKTEKNLRAAEERLAEAYQQALVRLRVAMKAEDGPAVVAAARRIKEGIGTCDTRATRVLERLIETHLESVEGK